MKKQFKKTVIINRAVPGSGKTTLSRNITVACEKAGLSVANHSTDDFFMENNRYRFNIAKLHNYHLCNLMLFEKSLRNNVDVVICDNTNIMPWQSRPYTNLARASGYQIIFFNLSPRELEKHVAAQKITPQKPDAHGVPEHILANFIRDFNLYSPLLNKNNAVNAAVHYDYKWNQRERSTEICGTATHFELDHLVNIEPHEYHLAKESIGERFINLIAA